MKLEKRKAEEKIAESKQKNEKNQKKIGLHSLTQLFLFTCYCQSIILIANKNNKTINNINKLNGC